MMQQKHKEDYEEVLSLISKSKSLAISRFADGEASILKNVNVGNKDGWKYVKDKNLAFRSYLRRSLTLSDDNFIYGISSRNVGDAEANRSTPNCGGLVSQSSWIWMLVERSRSGHTKFF